MMKQFTPNEIMWFPVDDVACVLPINKMQFAASSNVLSDRQKSQA